MERQGGPTDRRTIPRPLDPGRTITVVSGMPRSGTSMMMQMLAAAGLPIATDGRRGADEDNPRGYYELADVKAIRDDASFLADLVGRVVKIVAPLLPFLPDEYDYRVIFMERDLVEVLASQRAMLARLAGSADPADDEAMARAFRNQLRRVKQWLAERQNVATRLVSHHDVVTSPVETALGVMAFLAETGAFDGKIGSDEETQRRRAVCRRMAAAVDSALYRQRRGNTPST
ncbi:MAG TPA: sulfotransferase family protein [Deltaproteobacteria bacterium]|nr:sulfotransferase family protein [Deltaproteobacteria bacterium]